MFITSFEEQNITYRSCSNLRIHINTFIEAMKELPQVMECYIILGECDAMLKVVVPDLESYRKFQSTHLTKKNGITSVKTDVPSQIVKQSYQLPLDDL